MNLKRKSKSVGLIYLNQDGGSCEFIKIVINLQDKKKRRKFPDRPSDYQFPKKDTAAGSWLINYLFECNSSLYTVWTSTSKRWSKESFVHWFYKMYSWIDSNYSKQPPINKIFLHVLHHCCSLEWNPVHSVVSVEPVLILSRQSYTFHWFTLREMPFSIAYLYLNCAIYIKST
jgi:hypothetical protein